MSEICVKDLNINYGEKTIFHNFSADFEEGKINVILGGSGVGKTTLLNAFASLKDYEGLLLGNENGVSYIFQKTRLIKTISVYKNLDYILRSIYKNKNERKAKIIEMLDLLEIKSEMNKLPTELSGGQAQRVSMARAFLYPSKLLLLDEPFKALDTALKTRLLNKLFEINRQNPRTIIYVTHAIDECLISADKYFVLGGSPVDVILQGYILKPQNERQLADKVLDDVRAKLLKALY